MHYEHWLGTTDRQLATSDIAAINLDCAFGLPGAEEIDVAAHLITLDEWASFIDLATRRQLAKGRSTWRDKAESEAHLRMLVMMTVVQRTFSVQYDPMCMVGEYDASDARTQFIHGAMDGSGGTCASLPPLYAAIGRRLGYPLRIVPTFEHLFLRWAGESQTFNIECAANGFVVRSDEWYLNWPRRLTPRDVAMNEFLTNYPPRRELASFVNARGIVLFENLLMREAIVAHRQAVELVPECYNFRGHYSTAFMAERLLATLRDEGLFECWRLASPHVKAILASLDVRAANSWEAFGLEQAKKDILRIFSLRGRKHEAAGTASERLELQPVLASISVVC